MDSSSSTSMKITEGTIPFVVDGETYHTWFKAFGDLSSDRPQTITPLIALHGGPGLSHDYMTPITDITTTDSIPVILYDQLGSGRSTHLRDKSPSFWNINLFINELENLISYFKLTSFDIIGHSWGGMLGLEFAIRRQPPGLRRLLLASAHPDMALWNQSNMQLMKGMDEDVQQGLMKGFADPQGYRAALDKFHAVHGCRLQPFPKEFVTSLEMIFGENGDPTVSMAM